MIYEDNICFAFLSKEPHSQGHVILTPKEKYTILEQIPNDIVGHLFHISNMLSGIMFEVLGAHGTNTIVQNGEAAGQSEPQVQFHIIPRFENDGLNFMWKPRASKEDQEVAALKLSKSSPVLSEEKKVKVIKKEQPKEESNTKWIESALFRLP